MMKAILSLLALAALAACEATMTGPADPMAEESGVPAEGTAPAAAQGSEAAPWWST